MTFCMDFFKLTLDTLLSLIVTAMTLVAALAYEPSGSRDINTVPPSYVLASFEQAQDIGAIVTRLRAADPGARVIAACELQRLGSDARAAIAALVERLSDASPVDPTVCGEGRHYWSKDIAQQTTPGEEAAAALVAIGTESLQPLITAARAPQWVARRNAVWALGALDDRRAIPAALMTLADQEPPVRRSAAWALGALDADEAVSALIAAIADQDAGVRAQVAWALGTIGDRRAVDGLIGLLKDRDDQVRSQAAWALGTIGDRRASTALAAALKDASARVRRQAAWALGTIGG